MSGSNVAPEIARLKGEINAVRRVGIKKNCATAMLPPEPVTEAEEAPRQEGTDASSSAGQPASYQLGTPASASASSYKHT